MSNDLARRLRRNLTEAEKRLWSILRYRQLEDCRFRRQAPIGRYVVDFVCFDRKLIIEADGGQHARQKESDTTRTGWLESQGFTVLRFWNNEIFENLEGVTEVIVSALQER